MCYYIKLNIRNDLKYQDIARYITKQLGSLVLGETNIDCSVQSSRFCSILVSLLPSAVSRRQFGSHHGALANRVAKL